MNQYEEICKDMGLRAKAAAFELAQLDQGTLDAALIAIADAVEAQTDEIMAANKQDLDKSGDYNVPQTMIDRLTLTPNRIAQMAEGVRQVGALESPVGSIIETITRPNGLTIEKRAVPFGVIGIIFEARPNVTIDAGVLCLKTGNATILRGGKEAFHTNQIIVSIMRNTLESLGINGDAIQLVEVLDRDMVGVLLQQREYIDVIIPRGGAGLIRRVVEESSIPVIETGSGVCHTFVDEYANLDMALDIAINAKVQRPSVCNAMETLLVHQAVAAEFLPRLDKALQEYGVRIHGDEVVAQYMENTIPLAETSFNTEYNDLDLNVRIVENLEEAIEHVNCYTTHHSEAIITDEPMRLHALQMALSLALAQKLVLVHKNFTLVALWAYKL